MKLAGKVALVTGAGRGIGRAIALALAGEGADVAVNDIEEASAKGVAGEVKALGRRALALPADVADYGQVQRMVSRIWDEFSRLDILVNNAAILSTVSFRELSEAEWDRVMAVDLKGVFNCCRAVVEGMIAQGGGRIINIASIAGKRGGGFLGNAAYSAAKAGVIGFSKALARELASYSITVNVVAPGLTETPMTAWAPSEVKARIVAQIPLRRPAQPREIAEAVLFLASAAYITGEVLDVDGGVTMD